MSRSHSFSSRGSASWYALSGGCAVRVFDTEQAVVETHLRGRGVPHLRRQTVRGDLHVIANVVVPSKLSKRQRELLEQYAKEAGESVSPPGGLREKLGLG